VGSNVAWADPGIYYFLQMELSNHGEGEV
jgi:hypothetical protein